MLHVGLTGGIATGKSTASQFFSKLGVPIIDTDCIARKLLAPTTSLTQLVIKHFGLMIVNQDNQLDRKKLKQLIFNDSKAKMWLEKIMHPLIIDEINIALQTINKSYIIIVIPLLAEGNCIDFIDRICVIDCPQKIQKQRLLARETIDELLADKIIAQQCSREKHLNIADDVIDNSSTIKDLKDKIKQIHQTYLQFSALSSNKS